MSFSDEEKQWLLAIKNIGPKIITRLEELGFNSLTQLAQAQPEKVLASMAQKAGANCWHNNPNNRAAIAKAIALAKQRCADGVILTSNLS